MISFTGHEQESVMSRCENKKIPKMNNIRYRLLKGTIDLPRGNLAVPFHSRKKHDF